MRSVMALTLAVTFACSTPPPPSAGVDKAAQADLRGYVTRVSTDTVLVEEKPAETSGSSKASVRITSETAIVDASGTRRGVADLKEGQLVSVWFTGPVAKSYPVQVNASKILIE